MPEGLVLEFAGLSKRFGSVVAVDGFTARVEPGVVTGFLGPNGAGKTTTLRMLLGLVRPSAGTVTIGGRPYAKLERPMQSVGAVLEASSVHPGRTAANHLKVYAQAAGLPASRVDDALATVGLADVAGRKIGGYSLGMRQRLGLAGALLGDPGVLVLDEPANGLDPEGITWMRGLLRELARQGRTVLVSSHLLAEVQQTVDRLLIVSRGRLVFQGALDELADPSEYTTVADAPDRAALTAALDAAGIRYEVLRSGLTVRGAEPTLVGRAAASAGVALSLLQRRGPALEEVFFDLVNGLRVHASAQGAASTDATAAAITPVAADEAADASASAPEQPAADETTPGAAADETAAEEPAAAGAEPDGAADAAAEVEASDGPRPATDETGSPEGDGEADAEAAMAAAIAAGLETTAGGTPGAAFAVAATGVIDIVPPADDEADAEPDAEADAPQPGAEAEPAEAEPAVTEPAEADADASPAQEPPADEADEPDRVFAMPAGHVDDAAADEEDVVAGEPERLPDDDEPHEAKTESDEAADAFFQSFDGSESGEAPPEPPADEEAGASGADPADGASDTEDHDGGDVR